MKIFMMVMVRRSGRVCAGDGDSHVFRGSCAFQYIVFASPLSYQCEIHPWCGKAVLRCTDMQAAASHTFPTSAAIINAIKVRGGWEVQVTVQMSHKNLRIDQNANFYFNFKIKYSRGLNL